MEEERQSVNNIEESRGIEMASPALITSSPAIEVDPAQSSQEDKGMLSIQSRQEASTAPDLTPSWTNILEVDEDEEQYQPMWKGKGPMPSYRDVHAMPDMDNIHDTPSSSGMDTNIQPATTDPILESWNARAQLPLEREPSTISQGSPMSIDFPAINKVQTRTSIPKAENKTYQVDISSSMVADPAQLLEAESYFTSVPEYQLPRLPTDSLVRHARSTTSVQYFSSLAAASSQGSHFRFLYAHLW